MNTLTITPAPLSKKQLKTIAKGIISSLDVSETTQKDYLTRLDLFFTFFKKEQYTLSSKTFLEYKRFLEKRKDYSVSTKNKYLIGAKVLLSQYCKMYGLPDTTANVKVFTQSKKHKVDGLNTDEVKLVSDKLSSLPPTPDNLRVKSIVCFLALQGLRQIEIVRLDVSDVDFVNNTALVRGKGQDDKEVIDLHPETVKILKEYMKSNKVADGALFYSHSNNNLNNRLSTRSVRQMVKDLMLSLGIEKTVHGFRHFFTTKLLENYNGDVMQVAAYTRHRSLEMLQVYNDRLKKKEDLPRYYKTFEGVNF